MPHQWGLTVTDGHACGCPRTVDGVAGGPVGRSRWAKPRILLAALALHAGRTDPPDRIIKQIGSASRPPRPWPPCRTMSRKDGRARPEESIAHAVNRPGDLCCRICAARAEWCSRLPPVRCGRKTGSLAAPPRAECASPPPDGIGQQTAISSHQYVVDNLTVIKGCCPTGADTYRPPFDSSNCARRAGGCRALPHHQPGRQHDMRCCGFFVGSGRRLGSGGPAGFNGCDRPGQRSGGQPALFAHVLPDGSQRRTQPRGQRVVVEPHNRQVRRQPQTSVRAASMTPCAGVSEKQSTPVIPGSAPSSTSSAV